MSAQQVVQAECWRCERCGRVSAHREDNTFQIHHNEYRAGYSVSTFVIDVESIKAWTTEHCRFSSAEPPCPWVRMLAVPA